MIAVWLLIMTGAVVVTGLMTPRYQSEGKLFVRLGRENTTLDPTALIGHNDFVSLPANREDEINSVVQVLVSRSMAERVVDALGPGFLLDKKIPEADKSAEAPAVTMLPNGETFVSHPAPLAAAGTPQRSFLEKINPLEEMPIREAAVTKFRSRLKVGAVKKTHFINISYEATSPEKAQQVVNTLIQQYLDHHTRLNRTPGSHEFLTKQAEDMAARLKAAEDKLREFKTKSGVTSVEEQRRILEQRMGSLQDKLFGVDAELAQATTEVEKLEQTLEELPETRVTAEVEGHPNEAADLMRQQLFALELKEIELLSRYGEDFVLVRDIRRQIADARAILARQTFERTQKTTAVNTVQEQLRVDLLKRRTQVAALKAGAEELRSQVTATRDHVAQLNQQATEIARMERETSVQEANYRKCIDNVEQTRLDDELRQQRITNVVIAQSPTIEPKQVRPQKATNFALGFVFACGASLSLAFFAEFLDHSFRTTEQVEEELGLPTLASIPRFAAAAVPLSGRSR